MPDPPSGPPEPLVEPDPDSEPPPDVEPELEPPLPDDELAISLPLDPELFDEPDPEADPTPPGSRLDDEQAPRIAAPATSGR